MTTTFTLEFTANPRLADLEYELKQIPGVRAFLVEPKDATAPVLLSVAISKHGERKHREQRGLISQIIHDILLLFAAIAHIIYDVLLLFLPVSKYGKRTHSEQEEITIRRVTHTIYDFLHNSAQDLGQQPVQLVTIEGESVDIAPLSSAEIYQIIAEAYAGQVV